jgi:N4-gp56 family major capsid protein
MPLDIVTNTTMPLPVQQACATKLLAVKTPYLIHSIPATKKYLPRNSGRTLRFIRYNTLPTATVPLGDSGVMPPPTTLSNVFIDATPSWYGQYLILNEQVELQHQDPVLNEATIQLGISMRKSEDELMRNMMAATATSIDCVGGANGDSPTEITDSDISTVIAMLAGNDAHTILDSIEGANKFGTAPIAASFFGLCHSDLTVDLRTVSGFVTTENYPNQNGVLRSEFGAAQNIRFLYSSAGSKTSSASASGASVYDIFVCGMEAIACVEQDGASAKFIYRDPMFDTALALNATVSYKFAQVPVILNDEWVIKLRATLNV